MGRRNDLGTEWWSRQWLGALETRALRDPNRLPRGRTYARNGYVFDLVIAEGEITAKVQGSRAQPYRVTIGIRRFRPEEWDTVFAVVASQVGFAAELLAGSVPRELIADAARRGVDLLPDDGDLAMHCSCPDWAVPCKHLAAACYLTASSLDDDPFGLLLLRGVSRPQIDARLRSERSVAAGATTTAGDRLESATDLWSSSVDEGDAGDRVELFAGLGRARTMGIVAEGHLGMSWSEIVGYVELAEDVADASRRAGAALLDGSDSATRLGVLADGARRAAGGDDSGQNAASLKAVARRCDVSVALLGALAASWESAGPDGVAVAVSLNAGSGGAASDGEWPQVDGDVAQLARRILAEAGVRVRISDRWLTVVGAGRRLVSFAGEEWWAVQKRQGVWRVAGSAALDDLAGLVLDEPANPEPVVR